MQTAPVLETDRFELRQLRVEDAVAVADLWADPEVTRYMGGPRDRAKITALVEQDAGHQTELAFWPAFEKETGRFVGDCGLQEKGIDGADELEVVYVIAHDYWGKGAATEIAAGLRDYARRLGHERVVALIDPENVASARVAEKIGMRHEKDVVRSGGKTMQLYALT